MDAGERVLAEAIGIGQREAAFHLRNTFAGDGAQLIALGEFGGEHLGEGGGEPGVFGFTGKVLKSKHSDGAAMAGRRCRGRRMFFPAEDEIADDQTNQETCDKASQEIPIRGSGLKNPDGQSASAQAFQIDREFTSALVAAARILVQTLQDDLFRAHENRAR